MNRRLCDFLGGLARDRGAGLRAGRRRLRRARPTLARGDAQWHVALRHLAADSVERSEPASADSAATLTAAELSQRSQQAATARGPRFVAHDPESANRDATLPPLTRL